MRFMSRTSYRPAARRGRLTALAAGLGLMMSTLVGPTASGEPDRPTAAELAAVHTAVGESGVVGVAWYTDEAAGTVVVTADPTVSDAELRTVRSAAVPRADALDVRRTDGVFRLLLGSGDAVFGSGTRCSAGFNVRAGGQYYFLTAGHCGDDADHWYTDQDETRRIGPTVAASFPRNDYALVAYNTSVRHPGGYTGAGDARVGERLTRDGSSSGKHSGTVTEVDVSVRYKEGVTHGMIQADLCADPGDSGGPLTRGTVAVGITSGASGDCSSDGISFYQPVTEALRAYGMHVY